MDVKNKQEIVLKRLELESVVKFLSDYEIYSITDGKKRIHQLLTSTVLSQLAETGWILPKRIPAIAAVRDDETKHDRKERLRALQDESTRSAIYAAVAPEDDFEAATAFSRECADREPETVTEYVRVFVLLRKIIPETTYGDEDIRNKFLLGIKDPVFRGQLRSMFDSSTDLAELYAGALRHADKVSKAVKLAARYIRAKAAQPVRTEVKRLGPSAPRQAPSSEGSFRDRRDQGRTPTCHNCGRSGHKSNVCRSPKAKCGKCGREGHMTEHCRMNHANYLFHLSSTPTSSTWTSNVLLGTKNVPTTALLDTGASHNFVSSDTCKRLNLEVLEHSPSVTLGDGHNATLAGKCDLTVKFKDFPTCTSLSVATSALVLDSLAYDVVIGFPTLTECGIVQELHAETSSQADELDEDDLDFPVLNTITEMSVQLRDDMLERFPNLFGKLSSVASKMTPYDLSIDESHVVSAAPYFANGPQRQAIEDQTADWLDLGVIEPSTSPWGSGVVLVDKKSGDAYRMCIDFRQINERTLPFDFPLPKIDDLIDVLAGNTHFATLDMTSGYLQVPITERSKPFTTFVTHQGRFQFNRLPFGLKCAGAHFQYALEILLAEHHLSRCIIYQDDILIFAKSHEELVDNLKRVLKTLDDANIRLNIDKCQFELEQLDYLGWTISKDGKSISKARTTDLLKIKSPTNVSTVREVMGFLNFFRTHVADFASKTSNINVLTKKGVRFDWTPVLESQLRSLIDELASAPILAHYDPSAEHVLVTDASDVGLGGVLLQNGHPLVYMSKTFSAVQSRWPTVEKEAYAILPMSEYIFIHIIHVY